MERLERVAAAVAEGAAEMHEEAMTTALLRARPALIWQPGDDDVDADARCARGAPAVLRICGAVLDGRCSLEMQRRALASITWLATGCESTPPDLSRQLAATCKRAARLEGARTDLLHTLVAVATSNASDTATLGSVTVTVLRLMRAETEPYDEVKSVDFLFSAVTTLARFAHLLVNDARTSLRLALALRYVIDVTTGKPDADTVRLLVMRLVGSVVLPRANVTEVVTCILEMLEKCIVEGDGAGPDPVAATATAMLDDVAELAPAADLLRVVALCERPWGRRRPADVQAALDVVNRRVVSDHFRADTTLRLELLARSFGMQERLETFMPCAQVLRLLHGLDPPPQPFSYVELGRLAAQGTVSPLTPELALYIDDFLPSPPEERPMVSLIEICGRTAVSKPSRTPSLLEASCMVPRRVGLKAADAVAAVVSGVGASAFLAPADFADVGACLLSSMEGGGTSGGDSDPGQEYLRSIDEAGAVRIASRVLSTSEHMLDEWYMEEQHAATKDLCTLTGGVHVVCRAPAGRAT